MPNYTFLVCFKASDIELLSPKLKFNMHLTESPKRDHIYNCVYTC